MGLISIGMVGSNSLSKYSINRFARVGERGDPIETPYFCLYILPSKLKIVLDTQILMRSDENINIKEINVCPLQTPTNHQPAPDPQQNTEEDNNINRGSQPQIPHNGRPPEQHLRRSARIRERSLQLPH